MSDEVRPQFTEAEIAKVRAELFALQAEGMEILKQKERLMQEERLRFFRPLPKQVEAHLCGKRSVWVFGGNRSGKQSLAALQTCYLCSGRMPPGTSRTGPKRTN